MPLRSETPTWKAVVLHFETQL